MNKTAVEFLHMLQSSDSPVSGAAAARALGVSRNSIWKAVEALRREGVEIEGVSNLGYTLKSGGEGANSLGARLKTEVLGHEIEYCREVSSTNERAKRRAEEGASEGTLIIADSQTAGRGRLGRSFYSPGGGLYMSLILRPGFSAQSALFITTAAAVAVAEAIEELSGAKAQIKWVNDIYMNDKKVCGILTEAAIDCESGGLGYAVLGIGVNLAEREFPEDIRNKSSSVLLESGRSVGRDALAAEILLRFEQLYKKLPAADFMAEYRRRSNLIGRTVTVSGLGEEFPAAVTDIDEAGRLLIKKENGEEAALCSGEVSILL